PDLHAEAGHVQTRNLPLDGVPIANEDDRGAELAHRGRRALDDDSGAVVAPHRVDRDLQLRAFGRDDLATLVVPAVRTDAVRQLGLTALRTHRACGRRQLVVRAALAAAGHGVASLRQRHGRLLLVLGLSGAGASPDRGAPPGAGRARARRTRTERDCDYRRTQGRAPVSRRGTAAS